MREKRIGDFAGWESNEKRNCCMSPYRLTTLATSPALAGEAKMP